MKTTEQIPDYKQAKLDAKALFDSLEIKSSTTPPMAGVEPTDNPDRPAWPHIAYTVTFERGGIVFSADYKMGVGNVDWKKISPATYPERIGAVITTIQKKPQAQLKDKLLWASAAAMIAQRQKVTPAPAEVLATYCREALESSQTTFEQWASEFGYSADSRKAEQLFHKCREPYGKLLALIGADNVRKFADFDGRF